MSSEDYAGPENLIADPIDAAEDIRDPLEELAEKTAADPGAPFMPEALELLAALKKEDRAAFEALRSQLKKAGCRVTQLDEAIAEENGDAGGRGPTPRRVRPSPTGAPPALWSATCRQAFAMLRHRRPDERARGDRAGADPADDAR